MFDKVDIEFLYKIMEKLGYSKTFINFVKVNIEKYRFVTDGISEQFSHFIFNTFVTHGMQYLKNYDFIYGVIKTIKRYFIS